MSEEQEKKSSGKPIERATITEMQKVKLTALAAQANEALQGVTSVTKSDIVNLLIEENPDLLSNEQLEKLRLRHVDEVKYAFWMAQRLKAARESGESLTLSDLLAENKIFLDPKPSPSKKPRRKRKHTAGEPAANEDDQPQVPQELT